MSTGVDSNIEPFLFPGSAGALFAIVHTPVQQPLIGSFLYLPPFAEEMHKSRRMAALQARALAQQGYAVLQCDLYGCGDSQGDFAQARWETWVEDAVLACSWMQQRFGHQPLGLWGLRTGALLAAEAAMRLDCAARLMFWQPVSNGEVFLNQFLRLKLATEMLSLGKSQSGVQDLRKQLESGLSLEIGGYELTPALALALGSAKLENCTPACQVDWIEVTAESGLSLPPASARLVAKWQDEGISVRTSTIKGDPFWQTQEITECPPLIDMTLRAVAGTKP